MRSLVAMLTLLVLGGALALVLVTRTDERATATVQPPLPEPQSAQPEAQPHAPRVLPVHNGRVELPRVETSRLPTDFRSDRLSEDDKQEIAKYKAFVNDAMLTETQDAALRKALANATLTYYLGFQYVKGSSQTGVTVEMIERASQDDLQPVLAQLTESQRTRFNEAFNGGDSLIISKLFDVDALVNDLMPYESTAYDPR